MKMEKTSEISKILLYMTIPRYDPMPIIQKRMAKISFSFDIWDEFDTSRR